jgi:hypothetical protein
MVTRRTFLGSVGAGLVMGSRSLADAAADAAPVAANERKRMAVITTEWRYHSHAWHMAERFLVGYPMNGRWHRPPLDVVAAYVDQQPENDLSRKPVLRNLAFRFIPRSPKPCAVVATNWPWMRC